MNLNLGDTQLILDECRNEGLLRNEAAYVLATAYWETARKMKPIREMGGETYLKSKKYYPFVGMGYVQLTWERNYRDWSNRLGVDFVKNPKLLLEPKHAVKILVKGMKIGTFTGKKLSDYITLQKSDFVNARRIVNGTDKAREIAAIAREYDADLKLIGYGEASIDALEHESDEPLTKSKRFWTWLMTGIGAPLAAFGSLDWRVQLAIVAIIVGFSIYAIQSMPAIRHRLGLK